MTEAYTPTVKQAEEILKKYVKDDFLLNHCKIVSGVMNYIGRKRRTRKSRLLGCSGHATRCGF